MDLVVSPDLKKTQTISLLGRRYGQIKSILLYRTAVSSQTFHRIQ